MDLTEWDTILPEIYVRVPDLPDVLVKSALLDAADDFFRETWIWEESVGPVIRMPGFQYAELSLYGELAVLGLVYTEVPMEFIAPETVEISDKWPAEVPYNVRAAVIPLEDLGGIRKDLWAQYRQGLIARTLYHLHLIPDQDWTNAETAMFYNTRYREVVGDARRDRNRVKRVKPRRFV